MEIKSIYGKVLFSTEAETVAQTLKDAIKSGANLRSADLRSANLRSAIFLANKAYYEFMKS